MLNSMRSFTINKDIDATPNDSGLKSLSSGIVEKNISLDSLRTRTNSTSFAVFTTKGWSGESSKDLLVVVLLNGWLGCWLLDVVVIIVCGRGDIHSICQYAKFGDETLQMCCRVIDVL